MYSITLESEEREDSESAEEGFCVSERGYWFKSRLGCLNLVVDIRSFAVAVDDIAESRVTSTIGTCNSMRVWGARMLDTGTYASYGRNTLGHTYSGETEVITTTGLTSKSALTKIIPIPHPPDRALRPGPTKAVFSRSQASQRLQPIWT